MDGAAMDSDGRYAQDEADRKRKEAEVMNTEVNIDGNKLKLSDMFPDHYAAKDFHTKLKLLHAGQNGGSNQTEGEPDDAGLSIMQKEKQELDDALFTGKKK